MNIGVLLPHLDQPYFLKLLAGIEQWLDQSDHTVLPGSAHWEHEGRRVELLERMLARRVDGLDSNRANRSRSGGGVARRKLSNCCEVC